MSEQGQSRTFGIALSLVICGTCLVLMPQIHESVVSANTLFALGIARDSSSGTASLIEEVSLRQKSWMAGLSLLSGILVILVGAAMGSLPALRRL